MTETGWLDSNTSGLLCSACCRLLTRFHCTVTDHSECGAPTLLGLQSFLKHAFRCAPE